MDAITLAGNDILPLFVMDTVLPMQHVPLNIFEPRYRLMVPLSFSPCWFLTGEMSFAVLISTDVRKICCHIGQMEGFGPGLAVIAVSKICGYAGAAYHGGKPPHGHGKLICPSLVVQAFVRVYMMYFHLIVDEGLRYC